MKTSLLMLYHRGGSIGSYLHNINVEKTHYYYFVYMYKYVLLCMIGLLCNVCLFSDVILWSIDLSVYLWTLPECSFWFSIYLSFWLCVFSSVTFVSLI